jgi:hypothetical protein
MISRHLVVVAAVVLLAGCTAPPAPVPTPDPIPAAITCDTMTDVLTILYNADISLREGRTSQQEHNGAMILASSVLSRTQVEPGGGLAETVARLQAAVPVRQTQATGTFDRDSAEWVGGLKDVTEACAAAGVEVGVHAWTGG